MFWGITAVIVTLLSISSLQTVGQNIFDAQPRIVTQNGHLLLLSGRDRNITFKTSSRGYVNLNGENLVLLAKSAKEAADAVQHIRSNVLTELERNVEELQTTVLGPQGLMGKLLVVERTLRNTTSMSPSSGTPFGKRLNGLNRRVGMLERRVRQLQNLLTTNECASNPCRNGGTCIDAYNGYICQCPRNWQGRICNIDVNECAQFAGTDIGCQNGATCINRPGSYECVCAANWFGVHCTQRTDDCSSSSAGELCGHGTCLNTKASGGKSYKCLCDQGWTTQGGSGPCIQDVDECSSNTRPACSTSPAVQCINVPGSFYCGPCPQGYTGNGYFCNDIDECQTNNGGCSQNPYVQCINTLGSRICGQCPPGYQGDGKVCSYLGVCAVNNGGCHPLARCVDNPRISQTYVECICPNGYVGSGMGPSGCIPSASGGSVVPGGGPVSPNPCLNSRCVQGTCVSTSATAYRCLCLPGYTGNLCESPVDPCLSTPCQRGGSCVREGSGGFRCICAAGFTGLSCEEEEQICGGTLTAMTGTLKFPSSGSVQYGHNLNCPWLIITNTSSVIQLNFTKFELEASTNCELDFLQIHDGRSSGAHMIGRFCGQQKPPNITSTHNKLYLWFRSDQTHAHGGFEITWNSTNPVCGNPFLRFQTHGTLQSPGSPGRYPNNRDCYWTLIAPYGRRIKFTFFTMQIEASANCSNDYLEIHSGWQSGTLIGRYCNTSHPRPVTINSHVATLYFHTNDKVNDAGFQISYTSEPGTSDCGGTLTAPSGEITSPNHPSTYRENMNCEWHIQLPQNERIHLTFLTFSLESSAGCYYDYLVIRTGDEENAPVVGRYCGNTIPPQYTSSSNELVIAFTSDFSIASDGFRIRYEAICGGVFSAPSGVVTSPYYPRSYPRNRQCRYEIALPVGMAVRLCFQFFDVEDTSSPPCRFDYLEIRDGHNENSTLKGLYCGGISQFPTPCITSTYNYLWMKFKTDGSVQNRGFYANYTSINVGCGGVYKARTGTIQTPNYPLSYPHQHKCQWIIVGRPGTVVKLTWESFEVESSVGCKYDKVLVFDNSTVQGQGGLMGKYCGGQLPPVLITTDNTMTIIFKTDSSASREGFSATYALLDSSTLCGGTYYTTKGTIWSPNYPNWYPDNKDCTWVISVPTGQQIKLKVVDFNMEGGSTCLYDFLEIRNGGTSHSPLIGKFCGTSITRSIPSFTNQMYLHFKSDVSGRRKGFKITWDGTATGCGGVLNAPTGSITSPNYPQPYGRSSECFWRISVSQGSLIQMVFVDLDLEGTTCAYDYLEVYDGISVAGKKIGRYCSNTPLVLKSSSNHMYLKFRSDSSFEGRGFLLRYESVCNNIIKGYSGVIESPNFPTNYPNALDCTWNITAPRGNKVNVTFSHFDIESTYWRYRQNTPCNHDYVELKEGRGSSAPDTVLMGRKCGSEIPEPVHSSKDHVYVHMLTDHSISGRGFRLEWIVDGCGGVLRKPYGTISSPNYPGNYPIDTECEWLISVDWNHSIEMTIKKFSMESVVNCYYDSLTFYSGSDSSGPMIHQFCHTNNKEEIFHSSGNQMFVRFSTDNSLQGQGFTASYQQIDRKCGGKFTTPKGSFHTPNYPSNYDLNDDCQWLIEVDQNHVVWLEFTDFDLSSSRNCDKTFVKIYDGNSTANSTLLFHNCSSNMPQVRNFTSTGNQLLVHFRSGANDYTAKGFIANFSIACGARITATDTGIISTSTRLTQAHNNNCSWVISAANPVNHVTLTITVLDVSEIRDSEDIRCPYHFIEVRDGDNADAPLIGNYCGNRAPPHITSQGSTLFVRAVSLYGGGHHGVFSATYSVLSSVCGGNLSSEHGSFASPNYPNSYPVEAECVWYISTSPGNRVMLTFSMFQLETSDFCNEDYLEVRENSGMGRAIGIYCGSDIPGNLTAAHSLWIKFRSSGTGTAAGFVADYSMLHGNELNGPSGQVASPMYPRPYKQDGQYYWRITVENGKSIAITFREFFISGYHRGTECYYNYIAIYDGFDETGPSLLKTCASNKPDPLTTSSNVVYIAFSTNSFRLGSYFLLDWLQVERQITSATQVPPTIPGCGGTIIMEISPNHTSEVYDLTSPGFPDGYGSNLNCEWIFETTPVHHLSIYFQDMNLEESFNCFLDSVQVYTGQEGKPDWKLMSTLCLPNATYQRPIETSSLMKVVFKTDFYGNKTGFRAKIRIECGGSLTGPNGVIDMRNQSRALRWLSRFSPLQCEWNVTVRSGKTISVNFNRFYIPSQDNTHCGESSLTLRNGISHSSPPLGRGRYCGTYFQGSRLETTGNHLFIKYKGLTLLAEFKLVYREVSLACGGRYTLSKDNGSVIISSPNYPNAPRPHTECEWIFMAPAGERIHVDFLQRFDFTYSYQCTLSFVELRDGGTISSDLIGKFCNSVPSSQYTTGNTLYVRYFTDATDPRNGFKANVSIDSCGGTFRGWQGQITPPSYPGQYPDNMNCSWRIIGPPDHYITIWFDDLSMPNNTNCSGRDSVSVSEMITRNISGRNIWRRVWYFRPRLEESNLAKYCGTRLTPTIPFNSTKNEVKVKFFSDSQSTLSRYRGFSLRYKVSQDRCGGTIEGSSGVFQSPGYPSATTYRRFCQWDIIVPMGRRVKVEILDLDLESSVESYKHRLTFIDGAQYGFLIKIFYARDRPEIVRSLGNRMKVNFYSYNNVGHRGFKARFSSNEPAVCGGTINDANGYILPPPRSLNISDYFCEWQRTVQSEDTNKTLVFTILNGTFSGNSLPPCTLRINMVGIYPKNDKFTTLAEFCGNYTTPSKIAVPYTDVTVIASKRNYYGVVDFTMMYSENNCGGILSGPVDTLATPVGANRKYPPNTACTWSVDYPAGSVVNVTFISVKLDRNCDGDYLLIRNGPRHTSPVMTKCCGTTVPQPILSESSKIWIEFHSDGSGEDQGVVLRLEPVFEGCGGVLQTKGSVLTSPKFPGNYPSNAECAWEIKLADGYSVSLEFVERFDMEQSTDCANDFLEVFDFINNEYVSKGKYCDRRNHPPMINSTGPQMKVIFRSNGDVNAGGFKAIVGINCGGTINKTSGRIISPGFPNKYDPNLKCNYTIIAPPGQKINLVFTEFALEGGSYRCYSDWVKIYEENRWSGTLQELGKYCGTSAPPPMRTSRKVVIEFRSDGSIESQGFMVTYSTDNCGGVITRQGMIESPSFQGQYHEGLNCLWNITAPVGKTITLRFSTFVLEYSTQCYYDAVSVYDGNDISNSTRLLGKLCGDLSRSPPILHSSSNKMVVWFQTDNSGQFQGFTAAVIFQTACGGTIQVQTSATTLTPVSTSDLTVSCNWLLLGSRGQQIQISLTTFTPVRCSGNTTSANNSCSYFEVRDGPGPYSELIQRFSGNLPDPRPVLSSSANQMWVHYISDNGVNTGSFSASVTAVNSLCGPPLLNVTSTTQEFTSPGYPESYPPNIRCTWTLSASDYHRFDLHFADIDIESSPTCTSDYLSIEGIQKPYGNIISEGLGQDRIYAGRTDLQTGLYHGSRNPITKTTYCGNKVPYDYYSDYTNVRLTFNSNGAVQKKGFKLRYAWTGCNRNYTGIQGRIYMNAVTQSNNCILTIQAPSNRTIALYFSEFYVQNSDECTQSSLVIRDGLTANSLSVARLCGYRLPNPIFSTGNSLRLEFTLTNSYPHFDATYTTTDQGRGCGGQIFNYGGTFTSPFYPNSYRNNSVCRWDVSTPLGTEPVLQFTVFDIGSRSTCTTDFVEIYEVNLDTNEETFISRFCGGETPAMHESSSTSTISVRYTSSVHNGGTGWVARFMGKIPGSTVVHW